MAAFPVVASRFRDWREYSQQFAAAGQMLGTVTIAEKAVVADALKRIRKNMQQKAPQEFLAYSDVSRIHVKLLSTGDERLIPKPAGVQVGTFWGVVSWFPDSTRLLANAREEGGHTSVWTRSVVGQSARKLREGAAGFDVSPDGMHVAFFPEPGRAGYGREIWVMGSQGDNPQKITSLGENDWLLTARWSPDGQRLAYLRVYSPLERYRTSIETCDLKGANRTIVVPDTDLSIFDFWWLRDRRIVYLQLRSPRSNAEDLWQIRIDGHSGKPTNKPEWITLWQGTNFWRLTASADGKRLAVLKTMPTAQIYLGELSAEETRPMSWRLDQQLTPKP